MVKYKLVIEDTYIGMKVVGHATEYGQHDGKNIVCAAISTVCDMTAAGCLFYASTTTQIKADKGYHSIRCPKTPATTAIITTAMIELKRIEKNYPQCFEGNGEN